jgi:hypothetical protein
MLSAARPKTQTATVSELALYFCREIHSERYHFPATGKDATKLRQNDTPILSAGAASLIV